MYPQTVLRISPVHWARRKFKAFITWPKKEKKGLEKDDIRAIILSTNDKEFIKSIIEDKEKIEEFEYEDIFSLIIATEDTEYIKGILKDKEKREEFNFKQQDFFRLIELINDSEFLKKEIIEKNEEFNFEPHDVLRLIELTNDSEFIKKEITEIKDKFNLDQYEMFKLIVSTNDVEYINSFIEGIESDTKKNNQKINLPSNMTIGMEIESEGSNSSVIEELTNVIAKGWKCKGDSSLIDGVEVVSPILTGDMNEKSL